MDYRNIIAFATVLFATGYLVRSFQPANASPQGPNISIGSNPIESWAGEWGNGYHTVGTVTQDFIITDFILSGVGDHCQATLSSNQTLYSPPYSLTTGAWHNSSNRTGNTQFNGNFNSGMKIPAGTTIYAYVSQTGADCMYNISGYYAHP